MGGSITWPRFYPAGVIECELNGSRGGPRIRSVTIRAIRLIRVLFWPGCGLALSLSLTLLRNDLVVSRDLSIVPDVIVDLVIHQHLVAGTRSGLGGGGNLAHHLAM